MANFKRLLALAATVSLLGMQTAAFAEDAAPAPDNNAPSVVENLVAVPGDGSVELSWDPATDDMGVMGYYLYIGVTPPEGDDDDYEFGSIIIQSGMTSHTEENLTNDLTYYFAVTAYDEAGNESESFSNEVEATPQESETGDMTAPTVSDAEALTSSLVMVEFSEEIALPEDGASAFGIESMEGDTLEIMDAYLSSDDASIVMLVTADQTAGAQYMLTAGISVMDLAENPVESGTSDTAVFTGSSLSEIEEVEEEEVDEEMTEEVIENDFELDDVDVTSLTEIEVLFTEAVASAELEAFTIQMEEDASEEVTVLSVIMDEDNPMHLTLVTEEMAAGEDYILSIDESVTSEDGHSVSLEGNELYFEAPVLELADLIAPEDVTNLIAAIATETSVTLAWDHSVDSEGDLAEYLVYQSMDGGLSFGSAMNYLAAELGDKAEITMHGLTAGETYTFKVSAVDVNGNESDGVMTTITLPESGPGMVAMGMFSLLGAGFVARRKED